MRPVRSHRRKERLSQRLHATHVGCAKERGQRQSEKPRRCACKYKKQSEYPQRNAELLVRHGVIAKAGKRNYYHKYRAYYIGGYGGFTQYQRADYAQSGSQRTRHSRGAFLPTGGYSFCRGNGHLVVYSHRLAAGRRGGYAVL